jgi:hypothetical protein
MGEPRTTLEEAKRVGDEIGVDWDRLDVEQFRAGKSGDLLHVRQGDLAGDDHYERLEVMEREADRAWASKRDGEAGDDE